MGSDLHTGDSIFRPPRTYWDGKELVIEKWNDYHFSYKEFYRGPLSEKVNGILMGLGVRIPPSRKKIKKSLEKLEGQVEELKAQSAAAYRNYQIARDKYETTRREIDYLKSQVKE